MIGMKRKCLPWLLTAVFVTGGLSEAADFQCGFAKVDITPNAPLRLSGYGNRATPSEGVDTPLFVRAMALRAGDGPLHVLLAVDTIGFSAALTKQVRERVAETHGLSQSRFAICCSHSHTTPHLATGLDNLWTRPGVFQIYEKHESTAMSGDFSGGTGGYYYLADVPWTLYYDQARAIHGAYWRQKQFFGYQGSHGCVNLPIGDANWVYSWANVGDWVYVHDPSGHTPTDPSLYSEGGA